jgi:prolyl 4-hydroxylase
MAVSDYWVAWTHDSMRQQKNINVIKNTLRNACIEDSEINQVIAQYRPSKRSVKANPNVVNGVNKLVDYKAMANPPLVGNIDALGGQKIDTKHAQIYTIPGFLSAKECDSLRKIINLNLVPSKISNDKAASDFRTSSTSVLDAAKYPTVKTLDKKISKALGIRLPWSEGNQGQKYLVGQEFKTHYDYFKPNSQDFDEHATQGQRTWTFMIYLNNTVKGGGTHFPKLDQTFYPKEGTALIWNNLYENGVGNSWVSHCGLPVEEGEKMIITKWFKDQGKGPVFYA